MTGAQLTQLLQSAVFFGTVIMYGAIGEILTEKSGNLNLGVPGIMYLGGIAGLAASFFYEINTENPSAIVCLLLSFIAAFLASALGGLIYSFLTITLRANQNVVGLALTTFGVGFGNFFGGSISKLAGGVAVIRIGANTEAELREKKYRVEDALNATRAAIEEGIIPGGGVALCEISESLSIPKDLDDEEAIGYKIVKKALEAPIKMIAENAGVNGAVVIDELWRKSRTSTKRSSDFGFDARNLKWVDSMYDAGIIDPVKVTRSALQNAAGVASVILTAECAVADIPSNPVQQGTQI